MKRLPPGGTLESGRNNGNHLNNTSHPTGTNTHHYGRRDVAFIEEKEVVGGIDQDKFVSPRYLDGSICHPANKNTMKGKDMIKGT